MKKIYVERTEAKFGKAKLVKWTRVSHLKVRWQKFKKWSDDNLLAVWVALGIGLSTVGFFFGYLIYEMRSM